MGIKINDNSVGNTIPTSQIQNPAPGFFQSMGNKFNEIISSTRKTIGSVLSSASKCFNHVGADLEKASETVDPAPLLKKPEWLKQIPLENVMPSPRSVRPLDITPNKNQTLSI